MQRTLPGPVARVDVGPSIQQQVGNVGTPGDHGDDQRRLAGPVVGVDVGPVFQQQADGFGVLKEHGVEQRRVVLNPPRGRPDHPRRKAVRERLARPKRRAVAVIAAPVLAIDLRLRRPREQCGGNRNTEECHG